MATNGFAWVNVNNSVPGSTINYGVSTVTSPNSVFVHPLAGGAFVGSGPVNYWTSNPADTGNGRWISARLVSCGVRIIPSSNITVKSGTLTAGIIPGKTIPSNNSSIVSPTPSTLR